MIFLKTPQAFEFLITGTPLNSTNPLACSFACVKSGKIASIAPPLLGLNTSSPSSPNLTAYNDVLSPVTGIVSLLS